MTNISSKHERADAGSTSSARLSAMIRDSVLQGEYLPGDRIKIAEVSKRFGVSAMPVREALLQLEGEGLITTTAHRGAMIRNIDAKFIYDMYEIRRVLEKLLLTTAMQNFRADDLARLRKAQVAYESSTPQKPQDLLRLNTEFHSVINGKGDNGEAVRLLGSGWDLIFALRLRFGFGEDRTRQIIEEHRLLVEAISREDSDRAIAIAEQHCCSARDDLLERLV